jgi:hypothetical protein
MLKNPEDLDLAIETLNKGHATRCSSVNSAIGTTQIYE